MDYRQLIKVMIESEYPLIGIDDLMDQLVGEYVFSIIKLRSGYLQIQMKSKDSYGGDFGSSVGIKNI